MPRKKRRVRSAAQTLPYSPEEIRAVAGVKPREFFRWVRSGAVSRPDFRGPATRYSEHQYAQAKAVRALLDQGYLLREASRQTVHATMDQLRAIAGTPSPEPAAAAPPAQASALPRAIKHWDLLLLPGLTLVLRADATEFVKKVAQEIATKYASVPGDL